MLIELLYDLLTHSALFSVYFTMLVFALGLVAFFVVQPRFVARHLEVRVRHDYRLTQRRFILPKVVFQAFIVWFVRVFRRANIVQDIDEDDFSLSLTEAFRLRGGEKWKGTYSPRVGNI